MIGGFILTYVTISPWLTRTCLCTKKKTPEKTVKLITTMNKMKAHSGHRLFSLGSESGTRAK